MIRVFVGFAGAFSDMVGVKCHFCPCSQGSIVKMLGYSGKFILVAL